MTKMIRYVKQKDDYNCGPIAIVNILKWAGLPLTYGSHSIFNYMMKTTIRRGTRRKEISSMLRQFNEVIKFTHKKEPSLEDIKTHLDKGGAALLLVKWTDEEGFNWGHYFVVDEVINGGVYGVINFTRSRPAKDNMSKYTLSEWLARRAGGSGSKAWLIEKR